ncbi:MAG TPA: glutamate synthase subunit beta [Solirubrobacteraceae bacterium]|jgi:glutamate synthase (NADPH/NADH) small chain
MGELGAFLKVQRVGVPERDPRERVGDFREFVLQRPDTELALQGARCMECGVPFCHNGCPLGNLIPDWNDLVYRGRWRDAIRQLHATNNFPEFTGRLCPAPCEASCVLEIREGDAVTIKQIENAIINRAWSEGWVVPEPPPGETGRSVAVVGSGPAGMAAAQQLRRRGHAVTLFERDEAAGGLVRFGVPDFKIEKWVVERRVEQLVAEGVDLRLGVDVGRDVTYDQLRAEFDAVVIATGSRVPRDLPVPGRELNGVHYAMDYLYVRNRQVAADGGAPGAISARDKHVIVIGGGDTGADCVGNSIREGARSVSQLEILPKPPDRRPDDQTPWPLWPAKYRKSYAIHEAFEVGRGDQDYAVVTTQFSGNGRVEKLHYARAESFKAVPGTEDEMPADLVLLAMGFLHPEHEGLVEQSGVELDPRGNVKTKTYATSVPGVFAAGDANRGQSLIVWAINEGRQCARMVDKYLREALGYREPLRTGNVLPADDGPEGPPLHASPGIEASPDPAY